MRQLLLKMHNSGANCTSQGCLKADKYIQHIDL